MALTALTALTACDDDRTQACVPGRADRCATGETCGVDATGTPRCALPGDAPEGALCQSAGPDEAEPDPAVRCAETLGCLRVAGVSRCLRFCDPAAREDTCRPQGNIAVGPGGVQIRDLARCAAVLPDRPEIGLCVLPCRPDRRPDCAPPADEAGDCPAYPDDCPDPTACGLAPAAPFALCVPTGDAPLDAPCDATTPCAPGLLCARLDGATACRLPVDLADGCPPGLDSRPLAGTDDPFAPGTVQQVCLP